MSFTNKRPKPKNSEKNNAEMNFLPSLIKNNSNNENDRKMKFTSDIFIKKSKRQKQSYGRTKSDGEMNVIVVF